MNLQLKYKEKLDELHAWNKSFNENPTSLSIISFFLICLESFIFPKFGDIFNFLSFKLGQSDVPKFALICDNCKLINGYVIKELADNDFVCKRCKYYNRTGNLPKEEIKNDFS